MALSTGDIEGDWFGCFVHQPYRGIINVTLRVQERAIQGTWDFPSITQGPGKKGMFTATVFANWIHVRIKTKPLVNAECRLTVLQADDKSMIVGVIPLQNFAIPFATVTLFRGRPSEHEMDGICPIRIRDVAPVELLLFVLVAAGRRRTGNKELRCSSGWRSRTEHSSIRSRNTSRVQTLAQPWIRHRVYGHRCPLIRFPYLEHCSSGRDCAASWMGGGL